MTTVESPFLKESHTAPPAERSAAWDRVETSLERLGEQLNPILVKEARQALKSKQFAVTFTLLLLCGWGWSLLGIAMLSPGVYYAPAGPFMLVGYYFVLAVPLLVVVPFAAFRSLASEREDGTYELLSITALSPRLIVTGKLGSALLQMMVYYSALSPCIVFTYVLRGWTSSRSEWCCFGRFCSRSDSPRWGCSSPPLRRPGNGRCFSRWCFCLSCCSSGLCGQWP
jgi:hypothetical protein